MDTQVASDGVFIGRYVLVEYDDPPITGYLYNGVLYSDEMHTKAITPVVGRVYQDLHQVNTTSSFYTYTSTGGYERVTDLTTFTTNYNKDVAKYGRGYDSTAWVKTVDAQSGEYRYVMVAELNTVVPNFHLVADPPSATPAAPYFDGQTTNLDYYFHVPTNYGQQIAVNSDGLTDEKIYLQTSRWDDTSKSYVVIENTLPVNGDIYYNRAGFSKETRSYISQGKYAIGNETILDSINFTYGSSGRKYYGSNNTGLTQNDTMLWHIYLPSIGNTIAEVWDYMFTADRKLQFLYENFENRNYVTMDTGSVVGVANTVRGYLGRVYELTDTVTDNYTAPVIYSTSHNAIRYVESNEERTYYYPVFANIWTPDANGDYYYDETIGAYKVANKAALQNVQYYSRTSQLNNIPYVRYKQAYHRGISGLIAGSEAAVNADLALTNDMPHTVLGAIAYMNRIMGTGLYSTDSRDDRTVIGLMNRMSDIIDNIDKDLVPHRWLVVDDNGKIITSPVNYNSPVEGGVLSYTGDWVSRFGTIGIGAQSTAVTNITANTADVISTTPNNKVTFTSGNKWIAFAGDNTNKTITVAHVLSGIAAGTLTPEATGWGTDSSNADNILTLPTITFDEAGHITGHNTVSFYLPHSFKTFSVAPQSTAVANSTGNMNSIVADSSADSFTFATANKWLTIAAATDTDTLTFGHINSGVTAGQYGLVADEAIAAIDTDNIFEVPCFTVDEAGHITAAATHTVELPEGYTKMTVLAGTNAVTGLTEATGSSDATTLEDEFNYQSVNKWIVLALTDKTMKIAHAINTITAQTVTVDLNSNSSFSAGTVGYDEAGHVTSYTQTTYTLPYNWKTITTVNSTATTNLSTTDTSISATTNVDTLSVTASNKWILLAASSTTTKRTLNLAHALSDLSAGAHASNYTLAAQSPNFGASFNVLIPSISFTTDAAGHVTAYSYTSSTAAVTLPSCSVTDTETGNVMTGLSVTSSTGAFTVSRANIGSLAITGYNKGNTKSALEATDSLNAALAKLENQIAGEVSDRTTAVSGVSGRVDALETTINTANTGLVARVGALETTANALPTTYQPKGDYQAAGDYVVADSSDPYLKTSAIEDKINDAIDALRANYKFTLIPITVTASYADNTISASVNTFEGTGTIWLEKIEGSSSTSVSAPAPIASDGSTTFTVDSNGTYKVAVRRDFGDDNIISYSDEIIVGE